MNKQLLLNVLLLAIIVSMAIAWAVTSSSTTPLRKLGLSERQLQKYANELGRCGTVADLRAGKVITGRMSFCMVAYRPHYFLIVENGTYDAEGKFTRDEGELQYTFSYVPESVIRADRYGPEERQFREGAIEPSSLDGYNPFTNSPSHIFDSWKFTNDFLRLYSVKISNWTFKDYLTQFTKYNVLTIIPIFGITDCIGYSCYHIYHRADDAGGGLRDENFKKYVEDFIDMGFVKSYGQ